MARVVVLEVVSGPPHRHPSCRCVWACSRQHIHRPAHAFTAQGGFRRCRSTLTNRPASNPLKPPRGEGHRRGGDASRKAHRRRPGTPAPSPCNGTLAPTGIAGPVDLHDSAHSLTTAALITPHSHAKRPQKLLPTASPSDQPNECWQSDFTHWTLGRRHRRRKYSTGLDDHFPIPAVLHRLSPRTRTPGPS